MPGDGEEEVPGLGCNKYKESKEEGEEEEEELIQELEELIGKDDLADQIGTLAEGRREFIMIRRAPEKVVYGNVENVKVTTEDENDPELLAELAGLQLLPNVTTDIVGEGLENLPTDKEEENQLGMGSSLKVQIAEARKRTLLFKESGDLEMAAESLKEYDRLKSLLDTNEKPLINNESKSKSDNNPPSLETKGEHLQMESNTFKSLKDDDDERRIVGTVVESSSPLSSRETASNDDEIIITLKRFALEAKRAGDMEKAKSFMSQILTLKGKGSSVTNQKAKELIKKFSDQQVECQMAIKACLEKGDKNLAMDFMKREKAFQSDILKLRGIALREEQEGVEMVVEKVEVDLPINFINDKVPEDELQVTIGHFKIGPRCKIDTDQEKFFFQVKLEWPLEDTTAHRKDTPIFCLKEDLEWTGQLKWTGLRRDLRASKFFENHRIRIELYRQKSSFFRTKSILVGSGAIRMAGIVSGIHVEETIELADDTRRSLGISIKLELDVQRPLSPKVTLTSKRKTTWTLLKDGYSGSIFGLTLPQKLSGQQHAVDEISMAKDIVKDIASYVVLEAEISRIQTFPHSTTEPSLVALLGALQEKLDQLTMQVELGQLTMSDYLEAVRAAIPIAKQRALLSKRTGNLPDARNWLHHVHLMESEIAEAEAEIATEVT